MGKKQPCSFHMSLILSFYGLKTGLVLPSCLLSSTSLAVHTGHGCWDSGTGPSVHCLGGKEQQNPPNSTCEHPEASIPSSPLPPWELCNPAERVTSRGTDSPSPRPLVPSDTVIQFPPNCTNKDELGLSSMGASDQFGVSHGRRSQRLNKTIMLMSNNTTASGN